MPSILTVCTGNVCRSPLAALVLSKRLALLDVRVASAGTLAATDAPVTAETARLAAEWGVAPDDTALHRARRLTERDILDADLILAMTSTHRRAIADLAPQRQRSTFTLREFARITRGMTDDELAVGEEARTPSERLRAMAAAVAHRRGFAPRPAQPADDDVEDPIGRPWAVYVRSAEQMRPALDEVARAVGIALSP